MSLPTLVDVRRLPFGLPSRWPGWFATVLGLLMGWHGVAQSSPAAQPAQAAQACPPPMVRVTTSAPPSDRGMLWRVTRDGRSSWLYGTVHVGKPEWQRFGPQLRSALNASDVLALEIDPNDPNLAAELLDTGPPLAMPAALRARLAQAIERACVDAASLAMLHPMLQVTTLTVLEARWLGLDPAFAMEQLLIAQMRGMGRPVVALETAAQQKAALLPTPVAAQSAATEADASVLATLAHSLAQLEDQSARRVLARLVQVWERGDVDLLSQYERWCECAQTADDRAAMARLNDDRNPALAAGIVAQHKAGRRVFAGVGALHMTGPQALPLLLAQQGFRVERVAFGR